MKKIIVYNNFGDDKAQWIKRISKQTPSDLCWEDVCLVSEIQQADCVVVLDGVGKMTREEFDIFLKKDKIFLQREPEHVQGPLNINRSKFNKFIDYNSHCPYVDWYLDYDYDYLSNLDYKDLNKTKTNPICIVSSKVFTNGQRKRVDFLKRAETHIPIDFYGRSDLSKIFNNYRGPAEVAGRSTRDKSRLFEYNVSFSLENGRRENFWTRLWEDLLCWTMPIYWGCPNLEDFLPDGSFRYVDIEEEVTKESLEFLTRPVAFCEIKAIAEARHLILNKYNFFPYISDILRDKQ